MERRPATEVFHDWALKGKDEGMEKGHAKSVGEMVEFIFEQVKETKMSFHLLMWDVVMAGLLEYYLVMKNAVIL